MSSIRSEVRIDGVIFASSDLVAGSYTSDAEIVQAASHLHHEISHTLGGEAQDICDNPAPLDARNDVFHHHTRTGDKAIAQPLPRASLLAAEFFLAGRSAPLAVHSLESR